MSWESMRALAGRASAAVLVAAVAAGWAAPVALAGQQGGGLTDVTIVSVAPVDKGDVGEGNVVRVLDAGDAPAERRSGGGTLAQTGDPQGLAAVAAATAGTAALATGACVRLMRDREREGQVEQV